MLSLLGFLTTEDEEMQGNLGLKDALLALRWVRDNIEYFRGDKNAITLQGVSSGAAMVSHFVASPAARGCIPTPVLNLVHELTNFMKIFKGCSIGALLKAVHL